MIIIACEAVVVAPMQYVQTLFATFYFLFFNEMMDGTTAIIASALWVVLREESPGTSRQRPAMSTKS